MTQSTSHSVDDGAGHGTASTPGNSGMTPSSSPPDSQDVGSGWVMVPREPTDEMVFAGKTALLAGQSTYREIYAVMLSAAPPPPKSGEDEDSSVAGLPAHVAVATATEAQSFAGAPIKWRGHSRIEYSHEELLGLIDALSRNTGGDGHNIASCFNGNTVTRLIAQADIAALSSEAQLRSRRFEEACAGNLSTDEPAPPPPAEADLKAERDRVKRLEDFARQVLAADREALANHRPKGGLADCADNTGVAYQSQWLANLLASARAALQTQGEG